MPYVIHDTTRHRVPRRRRRDASACHLNGVSVTPLTPLLLGPATSHYIDRIDQHRPRIAPDGDTETSMKITDIRFGMLRVPLKTPFKTALRTVDTVEDIVVRCTPTPATSATARRPRPR